MDPKLMRLFQRYIAEQCDIFMEEGKDFQSLSPLRWDVLQTVVVAAGIISNLLWGDSPSKAAERAELRASLGVMDDSPLRARGVRNAFIHIDERLMEWWRESPGHRYADKVLGPTYLEGFAEVEVFRRYNWISQDLLFWGERFNLLRVSREVKRIAPIAKAASASESPDAQDWVDR